MTGAFSAPIRKPLPLIRIRGFVGLEAEGEKHTYYYLASPKRAP